MKLLRSILGSVRILVIAAIIGASSMFISFYVVNYLAREVVAGKAVPPATIRKANTLRLFSNELVNLCNEYVRRRAADTGASRISIAPWLEKVLRPELQFLQQRLDETFQEDSSLSAALEAAVARCDVMARFPEDNAIRDRALQEVAATAKKIDEWIDQEDIDARLSSPSLPARFP